MTQIFSDAGEKVPVTVIEAGPCVVVQKKVRAKDGHDAIQVSFGERVPTKASKPVLGHAKASGGKVFRLLHEFRGEFPDEVGQALTVGVFKAGDRLTIVGKSKGKGYAGGVKRHHFKGGPASHGSMFHRAPGSLGMHTFPGRTLKGKRLTGHMGDARVTVKGVEVVKVDEAHNLLIVKGPVPGARRSLVFMRKVAG